MSAPDLSTPNPVMSRTDLKKSRRIVVKIGSSSLTSPEGVSGQAIANLTEALAKLYHGGTQVVLVSSGAIAAGIGPMGLSKRPKDLATQQAAAAVGQGLLLAEYTAAFNNYDITAAQVLLTAQDLMRRSHFNNAFRSINRLLNLGIVPVVNENDVVATQEIRFGDNDRLAALVASLIKADSLLLLSDVDALYDGPPTRPGVQRVPEIRSLEELRGIVIGNAGPAGVGTGGMVTKVEAARIATGSNIPTLLTSAPNVAAAVEGDDVGTWFHARGNRRSARSAWLAFMAETNGAVIIDDGAVEAVVKRHRSLLPAGIVDIAGSFESGDPIEILDPRRNVVAKGLVNYSSTELPAMLGRSTAQLREELGPEYDRVVVHTDDAVILETLRPSAATYES